MTGMENLDEGLNLEQVIQQQQQAAMAQQAAIVQQQQQQQKRDTLGEKRLLMSIIGQLPKFRARQGEVWRSFEMAFKLRTRTSRLDIFTVFDRKITFLGCLEDGAAKAHTLCAGRPPLCLCRLSPWTRTYPRSGTSLTPLKNLT